MRVAFLALLLANLLYLGWAEWIDVPAPPAPSSIAGLPRMTLLSELSADKRAALAKLSLQTPPPQCVSVGPFDDPAVASQAATLLRAKSFAPQQRMAEVAAVRRFWVYLDGFTSDAAEMRVLHRLERAGVDDAEAMPADAGGRRVSLGLFTDRDGAERRVKAVHTLGFRPRMTQRMLPGTVYWLDVTLPSSAVAVPLKDVSDLEPGGGSSPVSLQPCPVAPTSSAPSPEPQAPASLPAKPPAPTPQTASSASASASLPVCKRGGGGPVPCVVLKATTRPSVL